MSYTTYVSQEAERSARWQLEALRRRWIAKFSDQQRRSRRWVCLFEIANWCASVAPIASVDDQKKALELACDRLVNSARTGEFDRQGKTMVLWLVPDVVSERHSDGLRFSPWRLRLTPHWFEHNDSLELKLRELPYCWVPIDLARRWLTAHGYPWPAHFEVESESEFGSGSCRGDVVQEDRRAKELDKSIPAHKPAASCASSTKWIPWDDDFVFNSNGHIAIQPAHNWQVAWDRPPFVIGDVLNAYEAAKALSDQHPYHPSLLLPEPRIGVDEEALRDPRIRAIESSDKAKAIFEALMEAYESRKIKPVLATWYAKPPADTTLLRFRRDDILDVISELGAEGEVIRMLMTERERWASNQQATASREAHTDVAAAVASTPPRSTPRPRAPDDAVRAWYEEHVKKHADNGTATSEEDDWSAARERFGDKVRQDQIRSLRRLLVPPAWRKQGRRPKHAANAE